MKTVHLGAAALNTTPKDWERNTAVICDAIKAARDRGVSILCLPELAISGYGCEDEFHAPYICDLSLQMLTEHIMPKTEDIFVAIGLPLQFQGCVYNTIALVGMGKLHGFIAKQNLAGDGVHYEPRFFKAWASGLHAYIDVNQEKIPIGDMIFDIEGIRLGFEICEDAWVASRPGIQLAQQAIDIILNPSASHFSFGKVNTRERFVLEGSRAFQCAYVYANLLGNEAGRSIYDGSCSIASNARIVARTKRFSYQKFSLIDAVVDIERTRVQRNRQASYRPKQENFKNLINVEGKIVFPKKVTEEQIEPDRLCKNEEFKQAVALGLFDYLHKTHTNGFAISLSGGADSAACLCLVYFMLEAAQQDCPDHPYFIRHFGKSIANEPIETLMNKLCLCAYQGTVNSSTDTREAARTLAKGVGARFLEIEVQTLVDEYENILKQFLDRPLNWESDDITRQNIQARCRAPSIWALANINGFLLIATSNRSEAAVGYCTMDGDTAGSLSPIAGIDKAFLLDWLQWAEDKFIPSLSLVNAQTPTAELRPQEVKQTDEKDLMPYPILNKIQKMAIVEKMSPSDIYFTIEKEIFPHASNEDKKTLFTWVERYFLLWSRNQWKRERYAPSFHLDDENLDPRSWCRYPILSGGYNQELKSLKKLINT